MLARTRRKIEMGERALGFSEAHPEGSDGYTVSVASLRSLVERGKELIALQATRFQEQHAATARRVVLRQQMRRTQMTHIARVAELAVLEEPGIDEIFKLVREDVPYTEFLSVARHFAVEAAGRREMLVRYGLADSVFEALKTAVIEFEQLSQGIIEANRDHVSHTVELRLVGSRIVRVVAVIDAVNRHRFGRHPELLAAWRSASNVMHAPSGSDEPAAPAQAPGGEIEPAA